ncbi:hypothetical protein [Nocardia australiensis]|uniref:hypothetical protein n=1 Tax=Nocardia australiensis TaxID=2887191 RepID=UPI001D142416|nr:hypothetical protein [Nocardia australiensis]
MAYIDGDGAHRSADRGATIHVHPDNLERFDRLNVLLGQEPEPVAPEAAPKPRTARARKEN